MNDILNIKSKIIPEVQQTTYLVGSDLLGNLHNIEIIKKKNYDNFLLFSDRSVFKLYGKSVSHSLKKLNKPVIVSLIPAGEQSKDFKLLAKIIRPYFQNGFTRNSCLISLGGGVVTDIGGFIASILLRGIENINIPTTLLCQVDAAIGGKSGVNFWLSKNLMYKNMIGNIKQPNMVISDVETLKTLPKKEITNGLGEMVKYWIGWGKPTMEQIKLTKNSLASTPGVELTETITLCQRIKIDIITKDPFEKTGERQKLNLGHTIGHAIEGATNGLLSHGEAVAIGLVATAKISLLKKLCKENTYKKIISVLQSLFLPINFRVTLYRNMITKNEMIQAIKSSLTYDKKGGTFVLIKDIGNIITGVRVEQQLLNHVFQEIII